MRAWAVSIGSELLSGQITDTNATFLAQECAAAGIELIRVTQVGDDHAALVGTLRLALSQADVVICTGGVGPTNDDLTREAIAELAGETPCIDDALLIDLRSFFANRGQAMPERNAKQAWVIPSCQTLPNPVGTAPGWLVTIDRDGLNGSIIAMPGVPREMYRMWREQALPALKAQAGSGAIRSATIKTLGIGESAAEDRIHDLVLRARPIVATYAKDDGVHIRVTAMADDEDVAQQSLDGGIADVMAVLGVYAWGRDEETLPEVLLRVLQESGTTVALTEVGSGGAFAAMLTSAPHADGQHPLVDARVLPLDLSLDADAADARSRDLAREARDLAGATIGAGIVVQGEFDDRKVLRGQAVVSLVDADESETTTFGLRASIDDVHRRAAMHAADRLRLHVAAQVAPAS